jgi:hypothetical protein
MTLAALVLIALVVFLLADLVWLASDARSQRLTDAQRVREEKVRIRRVEADAERQMFAVSEHALREMLRVAREDAARGRDGNR